jgi:hypothetical protein
MKKYNLIIVILLSFCNNVSYAQAWAQDPFCLGIIYVDVDTDFFSEPGSEIYLEGNLPFGASLSSGCYMQGLGSPHLYSYTSTKFYFSIIKSHLYWAYTFDPTGVFTAELYTGTFGSNGLTTGAFFYIVQYQILHWVNCCTDIDS